MRKLSTAKRATILRALCEGNSVNAAARLCGVSKITVLRLLADAGTFCAQHHDLTVCGLQSQRVQVDEVWAFCGCKDKAIEKGAKGHGSVWTWVALDPDSKIVVSYLVGERSPRCANDFMRDIAGRIDRQIQLTSDGLNYYPEAVERAFGGTVDYAMLVKVYHSDREAEARYSPGECVGCRREVMAGDPDHRHISTSLVERQNLTLRMQQRRFTRLTNAFSKKVENHAHAVALHFWHYNFVRKHQTLKTTPAVAAGIANRAYTMTDLVAMIEEEERRVGGRLTDYLPAASKSRGSK